MVGDSLFRLCSQTGVWSFKGENHTSVTSGLSDPLTFSPRAGLWVTHYKTELSRSSLCGLRTLARWQILNNLENMILLLRSGTNCSECWRNQQSGHFPLYSLKIMESKPRTQTGPPHPSTAVGNLSWWGPKANFFSFQKEAPICRISPGTGKAS